MGRNIPLLKFSPYDDGKWETLKLFLYVINYLNCLKSKHFSLLTLCDDPIRACCGSFVWLLPYKCILFLFHSFLNLNFYQIRAICVVIKDKTTHNPAFSHVIMMCDSPLSANATLNLQFCCWLLVLSTLLSTVLYMIYVACMHRW